MASQNRIKHGSNRPSLTETAFFTQEEREALSTTTPLLAPQENTMGRITLHQGAAGPQNNGQLMLQELMCT